MQQNKMRRARQRAIIYFNSKVIRCVWFHIHTHAHAHARTRQRVRKVIRHISCWFVWFVYSCRKKRNAVMRVCYTVRMHSWNYIQKPEDFWMALMMEKLRWASQIVWQLIYVRYFNVHWKISPFCSSKKENCSFGHTWILFPMICISDACTHSVLLRLKPCKRLTSELIHHAGQSIWLQLNDVMVSQLCHIWKQIEPISFKWDAILSRSHTHASTHSLLFRINRFEFISIHYCAIHLTLLCAEPPGSQGSVFLIHTMCT